MNMALEEKWTTTHYIRFGYGLVKIITNLLDIKLLTVSYQRKRKHLNGFPAFPGTCPLFVHRTEK